MSLKAAGSVSLLQTHALRLLCAEAVLAAVFLGGVLRAQLPCRLRELQAGGMAVAPTWHLALCEETGGVAPVTRERNFCFIGGVSKFSFSYVQINFS